MTILSRSHLTIFNRWDHPWAFRAFPTGRIENRPGANRHTRPLWAELVFALDSWLRRRQGVFEYSRKPDCILRAQLSRLSSDVLLSAGTFGRAGDRVIDLHLWNEQIPVIPRAGSSLAWGCRFNRSLAKSLRGLAQFLTNRPQLSDINIVRAATNLDPLHRIATRHGFEVICDPVNPSPWEHAHRFGQNILYWLLTLACHYGRTRPRKFSRSRQVIYLSRRALDCKYIATTRGHDYDDAHAVADSLGIVSRNAVCVRNAEAVALSTV
jgi:hypothetical protein